MTTRNPLLDAMILDAHARAAAAVHSETPRPEATTAVKTTVAPSGVQVDEYGREPTTGEYISSVQHPDGCRCSGHAAAPAPAPSLADAAQEVVDLMERGWLAVLGDVDRHRDLFARLRAALSTESERERLRRESRRELRAELASAAAALEAVSDPAQFPAIALNDLANLRGYAALHARATRKALADEMLTGTK